MGDAQRLGWALAGLHTVMLPPYDPACAAMRLIYYIFYQPTCVLPMT